MDEASPFEAIRRANTVGTYSLWNNGEDLSDEKSNDFHDYFGLGCYGLDPR